MPTEEIRAEVIDFERWRVATESARKLTEWRQAELARLRILWGRRVQRLGELDAQIRSLECATPLEVIEIRRQSGWK